MEARADLRLDGGVEAQAGGDLQITARFSDLPRPAQRLDVTREDGSYSTSAP